MTWRTTDMGNQVLERDGYYLSFNKQEKVDAVTKMLCEMAAEIKKDDDFLARNEETAIVTFEGENRKFFILKGDFRKELEACESLEDCMKVFRMHKPLWSKWTSDYEKLML